MREISLTPTHARVLRATIVEKLEQLEQHSEALDVGEDSFDDDDPTTPWSSRARTTSFDSARRACRRSDHFSSGDPHPVARKMGRWQIQTIGRRLIGSSRPAGRLGV